MNALTAIPPYTDEHQGGTQNRTTRQSYGTGRVPFMPELAPQGVKPTPSWADAWDGYALELELLGRSKSTISSRKSNVLAMARYFTATGTEPEQVTRLALSKYLAAQCKGRSGCGPQSLYKDLRMFWRWLAADLEIDDPSAKVARPKGTARPVQLVSFEDMTRLLAACASEKGGRQGEAETARNQAIMWLALESGLRRFELAALKLSDVDRTARTVLVRHGKGEKARVACYGIGTAQALRKWLRQRGREDGPLFTTFLGGSITASGVSQLFSRASKAAGVKVRPHMLRHSWADAMLDGGVRERDLMTLAGWSSTEMLKIYGAVRAEARALEAGRQIQVGQVLKARKDGAA
jgi:site-specific recombinase XerD